MKLSLHRIRGIFVALFCLSLASGVAFLGCRGQYGVTQIGGGGNNTGFLTTGRTASFFQAIQIDPRSEDSAGPQFVAAGDLDSDGLMDLVSAWNQSQPIQIHLQRRTATGAVSFETVTLAGNIPIVSVSGLAVADFDNDGAPDIAVMAKQTLESGSACLDSEVPDASELSGLILLYLGPVDPAQVDEALAWTETPIEVSRLAGSGTGAIPEDGGFSSMALGDMDGDGDTDVVAAWNSPCGGEAGTHSALIFTNQGYGPVRDGSWAATPIPDEVPIGLSIKSVALGDVDSDGDLDVLATYPNSGSLNVRWYRNPSVDIPDDQHFSDGLWHVGTVGQVATQADVLATGDIDKDGLLDVVVRSTLGNVVLWFRGQGFQAVTAPLPNIPWRVYALAEFKERTPQAIALADLNFDGTSELVVSAGGGLLWMDSTGASSVYDQWTERLIVDDEAPSGSPATTDPSVAPVEFIPGTSINSLLVIDLDGNGANDIVATFDRTSLSGLSNDALVWFRNTLTPR